VHTWSALALVLVSAWATPALGQADLPNANLPGNSPSLPNSNLPGPMPTENPIYLPNSDTSRAVILPGQNELFPNNATIPDRNPTMPPTPVEQAAADAQRREQEQAVAQREAAQREADAAKA
jgi:hypothetical protein